MEPQTLSRLESALIASNTKADNTDTLLYREFLITRDHIDLAERTVSLAFSSDVPYERWGEFEILGHDAGEILLDRMNNKAALLWMHNWENQIGVVEEVTIDSKAGIGRAIVRFSKRAAAEDFFQDVIDGIITKVSVGYRVKKWINVTPDGEADKSSYRVTLWEPYEISLVSIPADDTVGVGRSWDKSGRPVLEQEKTPEGENKKPDNLDPDLKDKNIQIKNKDSIMEPTEAEKAAMAKTASDAAITNKKSGAQSEATRQRDIRQIGKDYKVKGEITEKYLEDSEKTPADFTKKVLEIVGKRDNSVDEDGEKKTQIKLGKMEDAKIGMSEKECNAFSFVRFIAALAFPNTPSVQKAAAFELDASDAAAEKLGNTGDALGRSIPFDVLCTPVHRALGQRILKAAQQRIVSTTTPVGGPGGNLISTDLLSGSFIDLLSNRTTAMQLGFILSGLVGNVDIPRQSGGGDGFWLGEDDPVTASDQEYDQLSLSPKTAGARTQITRKMLQQSSLDIEALTRFDIARTLALLIDLAFYYGSGAGNQPLGITNQPGILIEDFVGVNPTYAEIVNMETRIATSNADVPNMAYVLPAQMRGVLKTTEKFAASNGMPIWEPGNQVNGYQTQVTNQITAGEIVFGNFADALIGLWGGLDMIVDPFTDSNRGRINITSFQDVDFGIRHAESFCHGGQFTP